MPKRKANGRKRRKAVSPAEEKRILSLLRKGKTQHQVAKILGRSQSTISMHAA